MPNPDVRLIVDGQSYGGWTRVRVSRSLEQLAHAFELGLTERWPGQDVPRPIRPGAACRLEIDGTAVIAGYVDRMTVDYDAGAHTVTVTGRDKCGDLVDCSAPSVSWVGRTLSQVAAALVEPYGLTVVADDDGLDSTFLRLKNAEGDTVQETLEAAARVRAVLLMSDGLGTLTLGRAGTATVPTALELGRNIQICSFEADDCGRFSIITVKGQSSGSDAWSGESAAQPSGSATDARISRHRPLTVLAEEQLDAAGGQARADWEATVRYGRSRRVRYTVRGWAHAAGLWTPGVLVPVRDAVAGIDGKRLLVQADLRLDNGSMNAELTLCPPEAYRRVPVPEPADDAGSVW